MSEQEPRHDAPSGCLLRVFWLILGNVALVVIARQLFLYPGGWFSSLDVVYWSVVALILGARYADIRYFHGATAEGKPATFEDCRRYVLVFVPLAGAAWLAVRLLGALWGSA